MAGDLEQLLDFGFTEIRAKKAIKATKGSGLQDALDWLEKHQNDVDIDDEITDAMEVDSKKDEQDGKEEGEIQPGEQTAASLKCDECGKLLRDAAAAEIHAIKTEHQSFSESTEAIKPLTAEEKAKKLEELKAKLAIKREAKKKEEEAAQRQNELIRRKQGQELAKAKEERKVKEALKAAEEARRDKEEERLAKARVKAQIEQDKKERAARAEKEKMERMGITPTEPTPQPLVAQAPKPVNKSYTEARIQIRPPEGAPITHTFEATAALEEVYSFVGKELSISGFKLATTFPRKVFDTSDRSKSLKDLQLTPSAALMVIQ